MTRNGNGHTSDSDPSACVQRVTATYFADVLAPPRRTVCRSDRLPFDPDFATSAPVASTAAPQAAR
jgi:hypothetical protein